MIIFVYKICLFSLMTECQHRQGAGEGGGKRELICGAGTCRNIERIGPMNCRVSETLL